MYLFHGRINILLMSSRNQQGIIYYSCPPEINKADSREDEAYISVDKYLAVLRKKALMPQVIST
jgi:hypothetical protein